VVRRVVVRGGMPSRGLLVWGEEEVEEEGVIFEGGRSESEGSREDMVAREEVVRRGGRV